jgi:hypothetical protein
MPLLQRKQGPHRCPDTETMCAVVEGSATEPMKSAFAAHKTVCPSCAKLHERLRSFDEAGSPLSEPEWRQTEKRLSNWLDNLLASDSALVVVDRGVTKSGLRDHLQRLTEPLGALKIRWLLIPVATLALVICSFLAGRVSVRRVPQAVAEAVPPKDAIANAIHPSPAITEIPSEPHRAQAATHAHPTPARPNRIGSAGPPGMGAAGSVQSRQEEPANETASVTPPASAADPAAQPTGASSAPAPPTAHSDRAVQAAQTPSPAPSGIARRPVNGGVVRAAPPSGFAPVVSSRSAAESVSKAKTEQPSPILAPAEISLEVGTRVWISLKSIRQRADGSSEFSGLLLLPVAQSGAVVLERNTQISGTISVRQGKTEVQITEFSLNLARYRLKGTGGEVNTHSVAGRAVTFDAGKVLETWIASPSKFGKLPEEAKPTEK